MKKSLLALAALSAFATAAQAQSSVTIYGVVDIGYGNTDVSGSTTATTNVKKTGLADSTNASSRIGFRGTEDLGGGLAAGFTLEAGLNISGGTALNKTNGQSTSVVTSGDSAIFGAATRQAFLTIGTKDAGTVLVGYKKQLESDFNDTFMIGTENSFGAEGQELNRVSRANQIGYTLPAFGGLTASVAYTTQADAYADATTEGTTKIDADILSANLIYKAGKLTLGAHMGSGEVNAGSSFNTSGLMITNIGHGAATGAAGGFAAGNNEYNTSGVGAAYDFGVARVSAMYGKRESGLATALFESTYTNIGVAVPMGKTTLKASLSDSKEENVSGVEQQKNKGFQLQADYSLSKRTTAWAVYGENTKKAPSVADVESKTTRVGLTHSF
jgi:predicted porin